MTDPIKQAIEALKHILAGSLSLPRFAKSDAEAAIAALEGLEKAEPVGWRISDPEEPEIGHWFGEEPSELSFHKSEPLFTHPAPVQAEPTPELSRMTAHRAAFFMERFKKEEKLLGPNEQAAVDFVLAMLNAAPQPAAQVVGLTDEQIDAVLNSVDPHWWDVPMGGTKDFARAAIAEFCRVNGIKPPEKAGAAPKRQHITDGTPCWCEPELSHKDPATGAEVWVHREPQ